MHKDKKKNIEAVLAVATGLLLLYLLFQIEGFIIAAFVFLLVGLFSGYLTDKFGWLWWQFAQGMGFIMGNVLLTLVFYIFLTPIALLSKMFKKDPLMLKKMSRKTNYIERNTSFSGKDIENVW